MVKDKIMQMDNGKSYYVLEEVEYNGKKYILSLECDLDNDSVNSDDYLVMELCMDNDELSIRRIDDDNVATVVMAMLLNKIKND